MADVHGGPAFPVPLNPGQGWQGMSPCDGMTLRDYFAAKAMQALIAATHVVRADAASAAYELADSMLAARNSSTARGQP